MTLIEEVLHEPQAPAPRRRWVTVFAALLVLPLLGVVVLRLGGFDGTRYTAAALAITPYFAGFGVLVTFVTLVLRRRLLAFTALLLSISLGVLLIPRYLADGEALPPGQRVRVMSANLLVGHADTAMVMRLVRDAKVDVLVLQELTPRALEKLDEAGLATALPYRVDRSLPGAEGSGIFAKVPLRELALVSNTTVVQPAAVVDLSGKVDIEIVSVHSLPPVGSAEDRRTWQADLEALPPADADGRPRVLAGDFNATLDHKTFHAILDRGYADSAELTGEGLRPTWSQFPYGPPVTIDHVLIDKRIGAADFKVYDLPGSDHNAVVTELALPR